MPEILSDSFIRTPGLMLCFIGMQLIVPVILYCFKDNIPEGISVASCTVTVCSEALVMTWSILTLYLLLKRLNKTAAYIGLALWWIIVSCDWLIDFALLYIYVKPFDKDIAAILAATDFEEGSDFVKTYINGKFIATFVGYIISFLTLYDVGNYLIGKVLRNSLSHLRATAKKAIRIILISVTAFCWIWVFATPRSVINSTHIRSKMATFMTLEAAKDLVPVNPELRIDYSVQPVKIVVIIGESHNRSHSSLYGYGKQTQPMQEKLRKDSLLFIFSQPVSAGLHTIESIRQLIGTFTENDSAEWYRSFTFIEAARIGGYKTKWLSNQSSKGVYDNPVKKIAEFTDKYEFTNNGMKGMGSGSYDERLLPIINRHFKPGNKDFTIIHLKGSHVKYSARYPKKFGKFRKSDYASFPENQRSELAGYDNSVLYNDSIVSTIMNLYSGEDAVVFYLSDHAQDLFESSPSYMGHAKEGDPESSKFGSAIPLVVYLSPTYQKRHPAMSERIKRSLDKPFNSGDLIYTLMDIMGESFAHNNKVSENPF